VREGSEAEGVDRECEMGMDPTSVTLLTIVLRVCGAGGGEGVTGAKQVGVAVQVQAGLRYSL
jgi:hypothetical protein